MTTQRALARIGDYGNNKMIKFALIGALLVVITVVIHAIGTAGWLRVMTRTYADEQGTVRPGKTLHVLIGTVVVLLVLHTLEIIMWANAYLRLVPTGDLASFEEAVYFSFVTFTTLGYGDITLTERFRLLSGIEALNGIMLVGWSTAMLFAVVQRTWQGIGQRGKTSTSNEKQ
jgi:hypothetical protein